MAAIVYKTFKGEIPREEPHLLPDVYAQLAENCDFARSALSPMKDGLWLGNMASYPVRGIYTKDGITFYTWSQETQAFDSPIIDDAFNRMYYLTPSEGIFRVSTTLQMAHNGGSPTQAYRAGLPRPTIAPVLSLLERSSFPDYPNVTAVCEAWWEVGGKTYGKAAVILSWPSVLRKYTFTAPTVPEDAPEGATLAASFKFVNQSDNKDIATFLLRAGFPSRTQSIPGSAEATLSVSGSAATIDIVYGVREARAYTYAYENTWNEESAPAPPATISPTYVQDVKIVAAAGDFSGYRPYQKTNIYRTYGSSPTYIKTETVASGLDYIDNSTNPSSVGRALETTDYYPPVDGLEGLVMMPNGWFAAFKGNTLYMSEPYRPHAWPYSMTFPSGIRGLCPGQQSLVVTAADGVYVVAGTFPKSAQQVKLALPQPGIAQRGMTNIDGAVAYVSNDNVILVSGTSATAEAGQKLFTRSKWRERYQSSLQSAAMRLGYHDGALVMTSNAQGQGFVIRLDEAVGLFTRITGGFDSMFLLPVNDALYYSVGSTIYQYNAGNPRTFDWWGKDFVMREPDTFGAGYIRCDNSIRLRLYGDGDVVYDETITTGYFRLPPLSKKLRWSVRLTGSSVVHELAIARSMQELKQA